MAETSVKNEICRHCGANVRPNSEFCYNCGGQLAAETNLRNVPETIESVNGDAVKPTAKLEIENAAKPPLSVTTAEESKLKSAASMRRKSKIYQPKRVEVIWEEHENAPNGWFILAAIVLTLFAVGVFYLAAYLK